MGEGAVGRVDWGGGSRWGDLGWWGGGGHRLRYPSGVRARARARVTELVEPVLVL